jgi:prepilin-type N-terminal cleavage/methylation domain-containing protein
MKNKKGFTLVELLAVVTILSILMVIAVPSINAISVKIKEKMLNTKMELAEQSLLLWAQDNRKCFTGGGVDCLSMSCSGTTTKKCTVYLVKMADYGLIDYDDEENKKVINPVNKSNINYAYITINYNTTTKTFEIAGNSMTS